MSHEKERCVLCCMTAIVCFIHEYIVAVMSDQPAVISPLPSVHVLPRATTQQGGSQGGHTNNAERSHTVTRRRKLRFTVRWSSAVCLPAAVALQKRTGLGGESRLDTQQYKK